MSFVNVDAVNLENQYADFKRSQLGRLCRKRDGSYRWPISDDCILRLLRAGYCHWRVTDVAQDVFHGENLRWAIQENRPVRWGC